MRWVLLMLSAERTGHAARLITGSWAGGVWTQPSAQQAITGSGLGPQKEKERKKEILPSPHFLHCLGFLFKTFPDVALKHMLH